MGNAEFEVLTDEDLAILANRIRRSETCILADRLDAAVMRDIVMRDIGGGKYTHAYKASFALSDAEQDYVYGYTDSPAS